MKLLTKAIRDRLPPIGGTEGLVHSKMMVRCKFFTPDANWTWYVTEFDGEDMFFGLVSGFEVEMGYFSLAELEGVRGPWGLPIERDRNFTPKPLSEVPEYSRWIGAD
jgi:hypothetical protein